MVQAFFLVYSPEEAKKYVSTNNLYHNFVVAFGFLLDLISKAELVKSQPWTSELALH